ncbi:Phospholipase A1 precursor,; Outer membrane phospholipase A [Escherichia coli IS1]|nr:Phospholipase A1 precursor,; Outer membrane phospholipase A [Escherichia coli IS1]
MRTLQGWLLPVFMLPMAVYAQEATVKEVHDAPAVRGSIIANMLQEHDNPFTLYPYDTNYIIYTQTSDLNKEAIASYDWAENARKDEVKFQLSLAFPLWRGILGPNSVLGASYTQKSWWQLSNSEESSPFRETNYEPQFSSVLPRITTLLAGRCAMWKWATTTTQTGVQTRLPAAGTAFIPA